MDQQAKTQNNYDDQSYNNQQYDNQWYNAQSDYTPPEDFDAKVARHEAQKVTNLKYKTFILVIFIFCWFWWGNFQDSITEVNSLKEDDSALQQKLDDINKESEKVKANENMIKYIDENNQKVVNCINSYWMKCKDTQLVNIQEARNYLLMSPNTSLKMDFDQKKILANIDKYLLISNGSTVNGNVEVITFAWAQAIDKSLWLYKVSITLTIDFKDDKSLLSFIQNTERRIFMDNTMLYKIISVSYDIVKYQENQSVTITLEAYFYK